MDVPSLYLGIQRQKARGEGGGGRASFRSFTPSTISPPAAPLSFFSRDLVQSIATARDLFRSIRPISVSALSGLPTRITDPVSRKSPRRTFWEEEHARVRGRVTPRAGIKPPAISFDSISRVRRIYIGGGENCVSNSCRLPPYTYHPPTYLLTCTRSRYPVRRVNKATTPRAQPPARAKPIQ